MMKGMKMCGLHKIAGALVIVGALNWGLIGLLKFNLVLTLLGSWPMVERIVYVLVGLSAIAVLAGGSCCGGCASCARPDAHAADAKKM